MPRPHAAFLLVLSGAVSLMATETLKKLHGALPDRPLVYYAAFAAAFLLAATAGWSSRRRASSRDETFSPLVPDAREGKPRLLPLGAAVVLLALTLHLQGQQRPPAAILLTWTTSLALVLAAFLPSGRGRGRSRKSRHGAFLHAATLGVLLLAAGVRLFRLETIPETFGGDEANQYNDGRGWVDGTFRTDPFGIGWYSTNRLGMLPAGVGGLLADSPISGSRRPYAVVGTLAVCVAAAVAGTLSGPWGALSCAALLAFAPHQVHFSRLASVMALDALFAALTVLGLVRLRKTGSPAWGAVAGLSAGAALYGYAGGQLVPLVLLLGTPFVVLSRSFPGRRWSAALAVAAGFLVAGGPSLHVAASSFATWNGRVRDVIVFRPGYWENEVRLFGSPAKLLADRFLRGTLGLLCLFPTSAWYRGFPVVSPTLLPALSCVGLGWLVGKGRTEALLPALIAAGNLAGMALTDGPPAGQRISSLMPMLAILGAAGIAGLLDHFPEKEDRRWPSRRVAGGFAVVVVLVVSLDSLLNGELMEPYGGPHAGAATSLFHLQGRMPVYRGVPITFHTRPDYDADFPTFRYLLEERNLFSEPPPSAEAKAITLLPGLHLFSTNPGWSRYLVASTKALSLRRPLELTSSGDARTAIGYLLPVARLTVVELPAGKP